MLDDKVYKQKMQKSKEKVKIDNNRNADLTKCIKLKRVTK